MWYSEARYYYFPALQTEILPLFNNNCILKIYLKDLHVFQTLIKFHNKFKILKHIILELNQAKMKNFKPSIRL